MGCIESVAKWQRLVAPIHQYGALAVTDVPAVRFDRRENGEHPAYPTPIVFCLSVGTRFALTKATDFSVASLKAKMCGL